MRILSASREAAIAKLWVRRRCPYCDITHPCKKLNLNEQFRKGREFLYRCERMKLAFLVERRVNER